jgi:hypothetical protein
MPLSRGAVVSGKAVEGPCHLAMGAKRAAQPDPQRVGITDYIGGGWRFGLLPAWRSGLLPVLRAP